MDEALEVLKLFDIIPDRIEVYAQNWRMYHMGDFYVTVSYYPSDRFAVITVKGRKCTNGYGLRTTLLTALGEYYG